MEKCIPIKKKLIDFMAQHLPDFSFTGGQGNLYAFRRENEDGIYDHIILQRDFFEGNIELTITEAASCYNQSWKGIPWFTVGLDTDIGVLITGKQSYDAQIGWRKCPNRPEALEGLFDEILRDINTHVLPFFARSHEKIRLDKPMTAMHTYMQARLPAMDPASIQAVKGYLTNLNKAFSDYGRACKKSGVPETTAYFDLLPPHPIVAGWLEDIRAALGFSSLSQSLRTRLLKETTILFRDRFDFYNLR